MDLHATRSSGAPYPATAHPEPDSEALHFLSQEEQECILFFEDTIESLDHDLEEPVMDQSSQKSKNRSTKKQPAVLISPKEKEIIDLVQVKPGFKGAQQNLHGQDFWGMNLNPEIHIEERPRHNLSLSNTPSGTHKDDDFHQPYHPAGLVPTPVVIAQKIAEHKGAGSNFSPSAILSAQRHSLESERFPTSSEQPFKQGPPTSVKPTHYPSNINMLVGSKAYNETIARSAVNIHERQTQMLTNLSGQHHVNDSLETFVVNSSPLSSTSFHNMTQDKSRQEALSKLGLTQNHPFAISNKESIDVTVSSTRAGASWDNVDHTGNKSVTAATTSLVSPPRTHVTMTDVSYSDRTKVGSSSKGDTMSFHNNNYDGRSNTTSTLVDNAGATSSEFNPYGGKTKVMNLPSVMQSEMPGSHYTSYGNKPSGSAVPRTEVLNNNYGGKTKVMMPVHSMLSEHSSNSFSIHGLLPSLNVSATKSEVSSNSYGGKSKIINPSTKTETAPSSSFSAIPEASKRMSEISSSIPDINKSSSLPRVLPNSASIGKNTHSSEGPESPRRSSVPSHHGVLNAPLSPEPRRRSGSKPKVGFPPQSISVQFSGRGSMDESRREALRRLGLLKDT